jgi:hypothetical protein
MDYRAEYKEEITGDSWLMRDKWPTVDQKHGRTGFAKYPKKLGGEAIKKRLLRALEGQGIRQPLQPGKRRHEWKGSHGFRKFFNTHALQASMNILHVEFLMNHKLGLAQSYMKPTEEALLEDYLKAVPALTIHYDKDKSVLEKRIAELAKKNEEANYVIKGKLAEREKEMEALARKVEESDIMKREIAELRKKQKEIDEKNKEFESTFEKWKRWDEMEESEVEAELEEMRKSDERVMEIEKEVAAEMKERKRKTEQQS